MKRNTRNKNNNKTFIYAECNLIANKWNWKKKKEKDRKNNHIDFDYVFLRSIKVLIASTGLLMFLSLLFWCKHTVNLKNEISRFNNKRILFILWLDVICFS